MWKYLVKSAPITGKSGYEFKMQHSFEKRKEESTRIMEKYTDKVPIIIEKSDMSDLPNLDKQKVLMLKSLTIAQLLFIIRNKLNIDSTQTIFIFINNNIIPSNAMTINEVYNKYADKDGFLYVTYSAQQVFG